MNKTILCYKILEKQETLDELCHNILEKQDLLQPIIINQ